MGRALMGMMLLLLLNSCAERNPDFVSMLDIKRHALYKNEFVEINHNNKDTTRQRKIELIMRHSADFKYNSLLFEIRTISPKRLYWCDTINIALTDHSGKWRGRNMTNWYDIGIVYRNNIILKDTGDYNIRLRYLNPVDSVDKLISLGIIIENETPK